MRRIRPNKRASGKGGTAPVFHVGRLWLALPERYRLAQKAWTPVN
jgi:hypothetical protein